MRSKRSQHRGSLDHFFQTGHGEGRPVFADPEYQGSSHIAKYILSFRTLESQWKKRRERNENYNPGQR